MLNCGYSHRPEPYNRIGRTFSDPLRTASKRDRNAQEGCRNGGGILARAFVLTGKQLFQLSLQVSRSATLFCGFECIHGQPVVFPEFIDEGCRCTREVEGERATPEGNFLVRNSSSP